MAEVEQSSDVIERMLTLFPDADFSCITLAVAQAESLIGEDAPEMILDQACEIYLQLCEGEETAERDSSFVQVQSDNVESASEVDTSVQYNLFNVKHKNDENLHQPGTSYISQTHKAVPMDCEGSSCSTTEQNESNKMSLTRKEEHKKEVHVKTEHKAKTGESLTIDVIISGRCKDNDAVSATETGMDDMMAVDESRVEKAVVTTGSCGGGSGDKNMVAGRDVLSRTTGDSDIKGNEMSPSHSSSSSSLSAMTLDVPNQGRLTENVETEDKASDSDNGDVDKSGEDVDDDWDNFITSQTQDLMENKDEKFSDSKDGERVIVLLPETSSDEFSESKKETENENKTAVEDWPVIHSCRRKKIMSEVFTMSQTSVQNDDCIDLTASDDEMDIVIRPQDIKTERNPDEENSRSDPNVMENDVTQSGENSTSVPAISLPISVTKTNSITSVKDECPFTSGRMMTASSDGNPDLCQLASTSASKPSCSASDTLSQPTVKVLPAAPVSKPKHVSNSETATTDVFMSSSDSKQEAMPSRTQLDSMAATSGINPLPSLTTKSNVVLTTSALSTSAVADNMLDMPAVSSSGLDSCQFRPVRKTATNVTQTELSQRSSVSSSPVQSNQSENLESTAPQKEDKTGVDTKQVSKNLKVASETQPFPCDKHSAGSSDIHNNLVEKKPKLPETSNLQRETACASSTVSFTSTANKEVTTTATHMETTQVSNSILAPQSTQSASLSLPPSPFDYAPVSIIPASAVMSSLANSAPSASSTPVLPPNTKHIKSIVNHFFNQTAKAGSSSPAEGVDDISNQLEYALRGSDGYKTGFVQGITGRLMNSAPGPSSVLSTSLPSSSSSNSLKRFNHWDDMYGKRPKMDVEMEDEVDTTSWRNRGKTNAGSSDESCMDDDDPGYVGSAHYDLAGSMQDAPILVCNSCDTSNPVAKSSQCNNGHVLCSSCVEEEVRHVMGSDKMNLSCPEDSCKGIIPVEYVSHLLPSLVVDLLKQNLQQKEQKASANAIKGLEELVSCPTCSYSGLMDQGIMHFICGNSTCSVQCCRYCKSQWTTPDEHVGCPLLRFVGRDCYKDSTKLPRNWDMTVFDGNPEKPFAWVPVPLQSEEGKAVRSLYKKTAHGKIHMIFRIQNKRLWEKYVLERKHIEEDIKEPNLRERFLFHGTRKENVDKICKEGFDVRLPTANGAAWGKGIYFSIFAHYSEKYAQGSNTVFIARVIRGFSTQAQRQLTRPPYDTAGRMFDSCVDNTTRPTMYILFNSAQCYPEYVVHFGPKK